MKRFAITVLAALLVGCASGGSSEPTTKKASEKVERAASTTGMHRVPLILSGQNAALVEMKYNGKPFTLLLDTGAQGTVMDLAAATALGIKSTRDPGFSYGVGAGKVARNQAQIIQLDLNGFTAEVRPILQDMSSLRYNWSARGGKATIGLLGYDILQSYGAIIDLNEGAMYLRKRL